MRYLQSQLSTSSPGGGLLPPRQHNYTNLRSLGGWSCDKLLHELPRFGWRCWRLTTNPLYLSSWWSRRTLWRTLLPLFGVLKWIHDTLAYLHEDHERFLIVMGLDIVLCIVCSIAGMLPTHTLWSDVGIVVMIFVYTIVSHMLLLHQTEMDVICMIVMCISGLHWLPVSGFALGVFGHLTLRSWEEHIASIGCGIAFVISCAVGIDYRMAAMWAEMEEQGMALACLLDHASNGFCSVDPVSGTILSASSNLQVTFGEENLEGTKFADFIEKSDEEKISSLWSNVNGNEEVQPSFVTCRIHDRPTGSVTFGAKIIPYRLSENSVELCIQVQGDRHFTDSSSLPSSRLLPPRSNVQGSASSAPECPTTAPACPTTAPECSGGPPTSFSSQPASFSWELSPSSSVMRIDRATQTPPLRLDGESASSYRPPRPGLPRPPVQFPDSNRSTTDSESGHSSTQQRRRDRKSRKRSSRHAQKPSLEVDESNAHISIFEVTSAHTCIQSAMWLIKHWNLPKSHKTCCPFHAAVRLFISLLETMITDPCQPLWSPVSGWQCSKCLGMNQEKAKQCALCFTKGGSASSGGVRVVCDRLNDFDDESSDSGTPNSTILKNDDAAGE